MGQPMDVISFVDFVPVHLQHLDESTRSTIIFNKRICAEI